MKIEFDPEILEPLIRRVVEETIRQIDNGKLCYSE
jgi:hypothetical protein